MQLGANNQTFCSIRENRKQKNTGVQDFTTLKKKEDKLEETQKEGRIMVNQEKVKISDCLKLWKTGHKLYTTGRKQSFFSFILHHCPTQSISTSPVSFNCTTVRVLLLSPSSHANLFQISLNYSTILLMSTIAVCNLFSTNQPCLFSYSGVNTIFLSCLKSSGGQQQHLEPIYMSYHVPKIHFILLCCLNHYHFSFLLLQSHWLFCPISSLYFPSRSETLYPKIFVLSLIIYA